MKDFLELRKCSKQILEQILYRGLSLKKDRFSKNFSLKSRSVAMLFEKPSHRTRVSFEVGAYELGAHPICLNPESIQMGVRESIEDVARVLSGYVHMIVLRTFSHENLIKFARYSKVPVINGLTDIFHPCQIMADIMTIKECISDWKKIKISYVGSGNNILHSWLYATAILGLDFSYSTPKDFQPRLDIVEDVLKLIKKNPSAKIFYSEDPQEVVQGADVIYTDVWVSMGQEGVQDKHIKDYFEPYQVNQKLFSFANKNAKFMHCLPAKRGCEVSDSIVEGKRSLVFEQAENRLHIQKAIMESLHID